MLSTFWTQLTYHFNRRTVEPLVFPTLPGGDEPTSYVTIKALYLLLQIVSYLLRLCHQLLIFFLFKSCWALVDSLLVDYPHYLVVERLHLHFFIFRCTSLQINLYFINKILSLLAIHPIFSYFLTKVGDFYNRNRHFYKKIILL